MVIHAFGGDDGNTPYATPTDGGDGHLYGTTFVGGVLSQGVAYRIL